MLKIGELEEIQKDLFAKYSDIKKDRIVIGMGTCGIAAGAEEILTAVKKELKNLNLNDIEISITGCLGICAEEPIMEIRTNNERYIYCLLYTSPSPRD